MREIKKSMKAGETENMEEQDMEYAGFWVRFGASIIDTILLGIITWPILTMIYGQSYWSGEAMVSGFWSTGAAWAW